MNAQEFSRFIRNSRVAVFTVNDTARIIGKSPAYSRLYLHRLKSKNIVFEVERGKYTLSRHPFVVASNMAFPAYISFLAALSYHGLTTQMPRTLYVVSRKSRRPVEYGGAEVRFVRFAPKRFFGYTRESLGDGFAFIAEPEKAIVDSLFMPRYCPVSEAFSAISSGKISAEKIVGYGLRMESGTVAKRLGYMLEAAGLGDHPALREKVPARMDALNANLPFRGKHNQKWRLIVNEAVEVT